MRNVPSPSFGMGHIGGQPGRFAKSTIAAKPVSQPIASRVPSALQASAVLGPWPAGATGRIREEAMSVTTTSPSSNPPATISSFGCAATCEQLTPSPPASSIGALPIGPPPKNGHSTIASEPLLDSHLPPLENDIDSVWLG